MSEWNAGYVTEIDYTYGYYAELNPLRARFALLSSGFWAPETHTACELGFGQGLSVNLHAAATTAQWWATDFNPAQALFAQQLANASGSGAQLFDQAFAEFCARDDLPDFDYIGLHGIWTWIADEHRAQIVDFVRRKLKVGGVLYISYNTLPGWSSNAPLRHLFAQHSNIMSASGQGMVQRVDAALGFAKQLLETNPIYARATPGAAERLKKLEAHSRQYLAHEYFNRHWVPMYFADMAQWLEPAKLTYGCSAHFGDLVHGINLTADQQKMLAGIPDANFRETVRDYMTNIQFRRDYWIKGARRLNPVEQAELLRKQRVMLVTPRADTNLKVSGYLGEITFESKIHDPLLDLLADHKPHTLASLEKSLKERGIKFSQLSQSIQLLLAKKDVALVQDDTEITRSKARADKLNAHLLARAQGSTEIAYLASPVTGGGVPVPYLQQLMLLGFRQGHAKKEELAKVVWGAMQAQGRRMSKDGRSLESAEENLAELETVADNFLNKLLPGFKALQLL